MAIPPSRPLDRVPLPSVSQVDLVQQQTRPRTKASLDFRLHKATSKASAATPTTLVKAPTTVDLEAWATKVVLRTKVASVATAVMETNTDHMDAADGETTTETIRRRSGVHPELHGQKQEHLDFT